MSAPNLPPEEADDLANRSQLLDEVTDRNSGRSRGTRTQNAATQAATAADLASGEVFDEIQSAIFDDQHSEILYADDGSVIYVPPDVPYFTGALDGNDYDAALLPPPASNSRNATEFQRTDSPINRAEPTRRNGFEMPPPTDPDSRNEPAQPEPLVTPDAGSRPGSPGAQSSGSRNESQGNSKTKTRQRKEMEELDWHCLDYVSAYDENLDCPICRSPLVQPRMLLCFHIFCEKCLNESLQHCAQCPIDRKPIRSFTTSRGQEISRPAPSIILHQLDNLQVRCPNRHCEEVVARSSLAHHYKEDCVLTKVACPDTACDEMVLRRDSRLGACLHKEVVCEYCNHRVKLASLEEHYDTDCSMKEVSCPHCSVELRRHRLDAHVAKCPERVMPCKYASSGCDFKTKQKDSGEHQRKCIYGMIMRMDRDHRADKSSLESLLKDSQDRIKTLEDELASRPSQRESTATCMPPLPLPAHMNMPMSGQSPSPLPDFSARFHGEGPRQRGSGSPGESSNLNESPDKGAPVLQREGGAADDGDRINSVIAYIDIFDAKVENLERYLGEVDARQAQLLMNELGPMKDQLLELRNSMGHMGMYVRWLMESFRQTAKQSVGLGSVSSAAAAAAASAGGSSGGGNDDSAGRTSSSATAMNSGRSRVPASSMARGSGSAGSSGSSGNMPPRRMSDRGNPPRL